MKKRMFPIITLLAAFVLSACGPTSSSDPSSSTGPSSSDSTVTIEPTGIVISSANDATSIEVGETLQLTASVLPEGAPSPLPGRQQMLRKQLLVMTVS